MSLKSLRVGLAFTGSFCTFKRIMPYVERIAAEGAAIMPIFSTRAATTDTRFGSAESWLERIEQICGRKAIKDIQGVEPIGPKGLLDVLVIVPCTGNTMAKLACGISDDSVCMAAKAQLRNNKPVLLAVSTNDGLGANAVNLGYLLNAKNIFFVPFGQDDPFNKSNSLVAHTEMLIPAIAAAANSEQIQPVLVSYQ